MGSLMILTAAARDMDYPMHLDLPSRFHAHSYLMWPARYLICFSGTRYVFWDNPFGGEGVGVDSRPVARRP
jgi:hypothetical protein